MISAPEKSMADMGICRENATFRRKWWCWMWWMYSMALSCDWYGASTSTPHLTYESRVAMRAMSW